MTTRRSALDLAAAIASKELSPTEAMAATLAGIDEVNPALNAIIWHDPDDALARAAAATERIAAEGPADLPPFFGVPLPIKDLYDVAGWPVTYGSNGTRAAAAADTALTVARLEAAGFVLCGLSASPEFGTITATESERHGITRNPWNTDHTPGGSSGGAGAAVASGMFTIAHASDGGGSIRIPASCNGLVGLKASRGRIPDRAVAWEGAATQGVVSTTVADTAAALDILGQPDRLAWWNAPSPERPFVDEVGADPGRQRVAIARTAPMDLAFDPACAAAVDAAQRAVEDAGHEIVDVEFDSHIEAFIPHFISVVNASLSEYDVDWAAVQGNNRFGYEQAKTIDSLTYTAAVAALQDWTRSINAQWGRDFDLLVTPTMPIAPPPAGAILQEITNAPADTSMTVLQTVLFTSLFNMNGLPAISLPMHVSEAGLPIGVQIVAGPWEDGPLLRVASQLESVAPWHDRRAPIFVGA